MGILQRTAVAAAVAGVLLLSGCVQPQPTPPSPDPTGSFTPVFESEEEALAAAEAAYAEYLAVGDQITLEGGQNPERIEPLVHPDQLEEELAGFRAFSEAGEKAVGPTTFDTTSLQQYVETPDGVQIDIYVCVDVSQVRILDTSGNDVTPDSRPERLPLEVSFTSMPSSPSVLLMSRSDLWSGDDFCSE